MNCKLVNRLTYKSTKNTKVYFEIVENEAGELEFIICTRFLYNIDSPNFIYGQILKTFKDVVLVQQWVHLRKETFMEINSFYMLFNGGGLVPKASYKVSNRPSL